MEGTSDSGLRPVWNRLEGPTPAPLGRRGSLASGPHCHVQVSKRCYFKVTSAPVSPSKSGDKSPVLGKAVTSSSLWGRSSVPRDALTDTAKHCSLPPRSLVGAFLTEATELRGLAILGPPVQHRLGRLRTTSGNWELTCSFVGHTLLATLLLWVGPCARRCRWRGEGPALTESAGQTLSLPQPLRGLRPIDRSHTAPSSAWGRPRVCRGFEQMTSSAFFPRLPQGPGQWAGRGEELTLSGGFYAGDLALL